MVGEVPQQVIINHIEDFNTKNGLILNIHHESYTPKETLTQIFK